MRNVRRLLCSSLLLSALLSSLSAQTYIWSGVGDGWEGQGAPLNTGTEILIFGNSLGRVIPFDTITNVDALSFINDNNYELSSSAPVTVTANTITASGTAGSRVRFDSNITLSVPGAGAVWDASTSSVIVAGRVTGSGQLTLTMGSDTNGYTGSFIFNNNSPLNTYSGGTTIVSYGSNGAGTVAFWNTNPFGSGAVTISNGAYFASHNSLTLANDFSIISSVASPWSIRNWDAPLTLTGTITLAANNDVIATRYGFTGLPATNNEGTFPIPGPLTRFPTIFTGNIVGGSNALIVNGPGVTIFNFTADGSTYTGGTTITGSGSLVYGGISSIPSSGLVNVGSANGYVGTADVVTAGHFAAFLAHVSTASNGSVGVDTLPGNGTTVMTDPINLTAFTTTVTNGIMLGTATSAILNGTITPQGNNYHFGNGGGSLYVQSALPNISAGSQVVLDDNNLVPLKLYLRGTNTYTGGTTANSGFIIFDGASAIPGIGSLTASGNSTNVGSSYIGFTDLTSLSPSTFLTKFNAASTWGIIGIDTHAGSGQVLYTTAVNLTGFNDGVFLGTATKATLTGTLTPSTVTNSDNTANTLRFTAGNGGTLTIDSSLTGTVGVIVGSPSIVPGFSDGTVVIDAINSNTNNYSGGTSVNPGNGITLGLGSNNALGTGALTIKATSVGFIGSFGLQATTVGLTIPNNIVFQTPDYVNTSGTTMALTGTNSFTLAGPITSGPTSLGNIPAGISLYNATPINVTLSGDNSGYAGLIDVTNGTLFLAHNNAAGQGQLNIDSASATVAFTAAATAPVLYGLKGDLGSLVLPSGVNLTIHTDNPDNDYDFGGVISGSGSSLTVTGSSANTNLLYLHGNNTYSGGTTITGVAAIGLGTNNAAGTGPVTVSATQGGLALNTGVTFSNALVYNSGTLAGLGTFNPSAVSGTGQTAGTITFGINQIVMPAIPGDTQLTPGTLTLGTNVKFANGGNFTWVLQDSTQIYGSSVLQINGNLDLASISAASFILQLESINTYGTPGYGNLTIGQTYMIAFVHTSGTITGFNPAAFTFDSTRLAFGDLSSSNFNVSIDGANQTLYLNFTAVPEPSTYALMALGLSVVALPILRRRRV